MDPIVYEEHSYEENELENTGVYTACAVTLAMEKPLEERETLSQDGTIETSDVEFKDTFCLADVNDHFLHSDGDMHSYSVDKEHKSCLNADEDYKSHLDSVQVQSSMSDDPVLK
jgi:hypothetical protein